MPKRQLLLEAIERDPSIAEAGEGGPVPASTASVATNALACVGACPTGALSPLPESGCVAAATRATASAAACAWTPARTRPSSSSQTTAEAFLGEDKAAVMTEPQERLGQPGQPQDPHGQPSGARSRRPARTASPSSLPTPPSSPLAASSRATCRRRARTRQQPLQGQPGQQPLQGQPGQPAPDGYGQPGPPWGAYGQPAQQPFQQPGQPPYGQPGRPPYQQPPVPPMPPYQQQAYAQPPRQPRKKAWPWVLGICLLVVVLGLGGCVGCVSCAMYLDEGYNGSIDRYDDSGGTNSGRGYGYGVRLAAMTAPAIPPATREACTFRETTSRPSSRKSTAPCPAGWKTARARPASSRWASARTSSRACTTWRESQTEDEANFLVFEPHGGRRCLRAR